MEAEALAVAEAAEQLPAARLPQAVVMVPRRAPVVELVLEEVAAVEAAPLHRSPCTARNNEGRAALLFLLVFCRRGL